MVATSYLVLPCSKAAKEILGHGLIRGCLLGVGTMDQRCNINKAEVAGSKTQESHKGTTRSYRRGVGIMLLNSRDLVFAARRIDMAVEAWQMPQGGIDGAEAPRAAAMRELKEEIGTNDVEIIGESRDWLRYDFPEEFARTAWGGRYHGQSQIWYAMRFRGRDREINLDTSGHAEFSDWRWMTPIDVLNAIVNFKRPVYDAVFEEFKAILRS